jgi:hypothetical protein
MERHLQLAMEIGENGRSAGAAKGRLRDQQGPIRGLRAARNTDVRFGIAPLGPFSTRQPVLTGRAFSYNSPARRRAS